MIIDHRNTHTYTARRFKKQIFLSVDVPAAFATLGDGPKVVLAAEKAVVQTLQELEART